MVKISRLVFVGAIATFILCLGLMKFQETFQPEVAFGVYDFNRNFSQKYVLIEHQFVTWQLDEATEFVAAVKKARQANRFPMITLESWPWEQKGMTSETLFQDIVSGKYDSTLELIFKAAKQEAPHKILLRWGHEMEVVGQYPWSKEDAKAYIASYRYIVEFSRKIGAKNILWVWSPAGHMYANRYWPGDEYVDYTGVSIYASRALDRILGYAETRSFEKLMTERYWLAERYQKSMIVAEVGVSDDVENKKAWLTDAVTALTKFPKIKCWVYFDAIHPKFVQFPTGRPNWSLSEREVEVLVDSWKEFNNDRLSNKNIDKYIESNLASPIGKF